MHCNKYKYDNWNNILATVDDIFEELHFRMQVDKGIKELDDGKGLDHSEVKQRFSRWLEK